MTETLPEPQQDHPLIRRSNFQSIDEYVLHLIHVHAYEQAGRYAAGRRYLDWGCNDGFGIAIVRQDAASVAGLDTAPHAVAAARSRLGRDVSVELFDGVRSPFPDAGFDVITCFQLIEHVRDPAPFLAEVRRLLAPGGVALFTTPNGDERLNPGAPPWNPFHEHEFSPRELRELLERYFASVELLGLTGRRDMVEIERARVEGAKAHQRRALARSETPLRARLQPVRSMVGRQLRRLRSTNALSSTVMGAYSTQDVHYAPDMVEGALDLMAVCREARS